MSFEVLSLKITGIDWDEERITVTSPKTEHHEGMDKRVIPLFPELKEELLRACELLQKEQFTLSTKSIVKRQMAPMLAKLQPADDL